MTVHKSFANYFKAERDRSERALAALVDILGLPGKTADEAVDAQDAHEAAEESARSLYRRELVGRVLVWDGSLLLARRQ